MCKKRKYVKISSENGIKLFEDAFFDFCHDYKLTKAELYSLRYICSEFKFDICNPPIFKKIGLNEIIDSFNASSDVLFSETGFYLKPSIDDIITRLGNRMCFIIAEHCDSETIKQVNVYIPNEKDTTLFITDIYNTTEEFIRNFEETNKNSILYALQDNTIISITDLDYENEFFIITNLDIKGSTVLFHHIP